MSPIFDVMYVETISPYLDGKMEMNAALAQGLAMMKEFMVTNTRVDTLNLFAPNVNLTKLESFTVNNTFDQALFYLDIEGHFNHPKINAALEVLKKNTESLDILGVYQESNYRNKD